MSVLQFLAVLIEELVPAIDVSGNVGQLLTLTILSKNSGTCVLEDLTVANVVLVQASPHGESIPGL